MTVAASFGTAGSVPDAANSAALSASQRGALTRSDPLLNVDHHGRTLADPDAGGRHRVAAAPPAQLTAGVHHHPRRRGAKRVADGERTTVGIDPFPVDLRG